MISSNLKLRKYNVQMKDQPNKSFNMIKNWKKNKLKYLIGIANFHKRM